MSILVCRPSDDSLGGLVLVLCFACACGECALQHVIVFTGDFAYDMHEVRNTHISDDPHHFDQIV